uniref:putative tryptophan synthase alpha subunit n=1 Tax=Pyropia seriata TaxID=79731 RepID=UPI00286B82AB|nr:putative tryptophan synthase alpha subunit [Neoporphyra seriata]WKD84134.1 putative tryptophan synthase alpha subunit [Neoporphyra seriata]
MTISSSIAADFTDKLAVKIITGLNNFDIEQVMKMTQAAEIAKATYMDIAANMSIINELQSSSTIPICVSGISATKLVQCQQAGVQILEIGNYDTFYEQGRLFSHKEIMEISQDIRNLLPDTTLCVTIPHMLCIEEQIKLTHNLKDIGVDIIQTEGKSTSFSKNSDLSGVIQKAASTCSSTYAISQNSNMPIVSASGISSLTTPISFLYGASCIGVGNNIRQLNNITSMVMYIYEIKTAIECNRSTKREITHSIRKSSITSDLLSSIIRV